MAKALGENDAVDLLDANLAQEKETLREVEKIATRVSNESFAEVAQPVQRRDFGFRAGYMPRESGESERQAEPGGSLKR